MKAFLAIIVIGAVFASEEEWTTFKKTHNKIYLNIKEENYRKNVFLQNLELIKNHNKKYELGLVSYSVKVNQLADRLYQEIFPPKKATKTRKAAKVYSGRKFTKTSEVSVPESIDWRDFGVVTPVSDQESCNACWAFAIVGALEAHIGIYENRTVRLSQQNLEECVYTDFTCPEELRITSLEDSYQYIKDNGGIDTLETYPYLNYMVNPCSYSSNNVGATIKDFGTIDEADEESLKIVVGTIGPVSIEITTDFTWSIYQSGVYYKENCLNVTEPFNHAVVIVGYGTENGQDYWLVRNSWNTWFGDEGYIKMARNRENNCGVASYARYPIMV